MEIKKQLPDGTVYRVYGMGPACVFIHGFAEDGHVWDVQVEGLKNDFTCVVIDMPGTGDSIEAFEAHKGITLDDAAELVMNVVQHEGLSSFTLFGHSMGGYITLALAEKYPEKLNGLGLVHSTAFADTEEKLETRRRSVTFMRNHGVRLFLEQLYPNLYGEKFKNEHPAEIDRQVRASEVFQPEVLIRYYEMMMVRPDRTDVFRSFQKPVLFIIGAEDKAVNLTDSLAQCHLPLESHVHILENVGHMGMKEVPEKTTGFLRTFLAYLNEKR